MPTKTFHSTDVTGAAQDYTGGGPTGSITPVITLNSFGHFELTGLGSSVGSGQGISFTYRQTGNVNFIGSLGIPISSLITEVIITKPRHVIININADGVGGDIGIQALIPNDNSLPIPTYDLNDPASISYSSNLSGIPSQQVFDYSSAPITVTQLIATHGSILFELNLVVNSGKTNNNEIDFNMGFGPGWEIQVTYDELPLEWTVESSDDPYLPGKSKISIKSKKGGLEDIVTDSDTNPDDPLTPEDPFNKIADSYPIHPIDPLNLEDIFNKPPNLIYPVDPKQKSGIIIELVIGLVTIIYAIPMKDVVLISPYLITFIIRYWIIIKIIKLIPTVLDTVVTITVKVKVVGTTFSGTVTLGTLNILIADVTGMYVMIKDKRSDTVYDRTGDTREIKIPDPFAKTGFID